MRVEMGKSFMRECWAVNRERRSRLDTRGERPETCPDMSGSAAVCTS